jgi:hypothetical protein
MIHFSMVFASLEAVVVALEVEAVVAGPVPKITGKFLCMGFGTTEIIVGREEWGHPRMLSIVRACSTMLASGIRELTGRICRASPTGINYHLDSKRVSKAVTKTSAML